ncbi:MAG TPA: hypothetical protein VFV95_20750 [Vicinamibacterales bacterium]|nr:hypothetical protein [Vicinamibacterales bacterium]
MIERWPTAIWAAGGLLFAVLATANAGGYRYGASDQAFYIPAIVRALNPAAFPRDAALIDPQSRLTVFDDAAAAVVRATGASLDTVFIAGYLLTIALLWLALLLVGNQLFASPWCSVALAAIVTLRHRIPRTSVNSFEPYFYPRMLAFAIGALAVAGVLHRRLWLAAILVAVSAAIHPTTGLWFMVLIGVAACVLDPRARRLAIVGAVAAGLAAVWAVSRGPFAPAMTRMDDDWLGAVASKDSLFATAWPAWAWIANLALPAALWWVHRLRTARGTATSQDAAIVRGALALAALFLLTLPGVAMRWALPTEFQISRVFWLIDFLVAVYLVAWIGEQFIRKSSHRLLRAVAVALLLLSAGRAAYVMLIEFPDRSLFQVHLRQTPWQEAMDWLKRQPLDVHVYADPDHATKYGTSVRVAAERDVFLEETKDSAMAIYSRDVASRVLERRLLIAVAQLTRGRDIFSPDFVRQLTTRYGVDYVITEDTLPLSLAYSNSRFHIYALDARAPEPHAQ